MTPPERTRFERRRADWLDYAEARRRVMELAGPVDVERVPVDDALGRALAERVTATATLPPWDNSAMDGYAVRAEDLAHASREHPVRLEVVAALQAGEGSGAGVGPGQAVRIMTGAPVPPGADTVVRVEDTDAETRPGVVSIFEARDRGRHVRRAGRDMVEGETLLAPGDAITAGTVGLLAAAGCASITVYRPPSVAILTTGNELRSADRYDDVRAGGGIPDSNGPMLAAMVRAIGARPVFLGIASDSAPDLTRRIERGSECDVLVTVGGASMGEADLVKRVLEDLGYEQDFWRVRMRPGSPFGLGWLPRGGSARQPVFGLPGNPASAFVTFEVFVRPFLLALAGHARHARPTVRCSSTEPIDTPAALTYFQRVRLSRGSDTVLATLTGSQGSGLVSGLASADGLAVVPAEVERIDPGDELDVMLLDGAWADASGSAV